MLPASDGEAVIRQVSGRPILTMDRMRETERRAFERGRLTPDDLMERAGLEIAQQVRRIDPSRPVLVLAGSGDAGGHAYAAACHLADWGQEVRIVAFGELNDGPAARMVARWTGTTLTAGSDFWLGRGHIVVDGLFETARASDGTLPGWDINLFTLNSYTIAIDVPSWIDADTGKHWGYEHHNPRADLTVALGALKPVHMLAPESCGHLLFLDYGPEIIDGHYGRIKWIEDYEDFSWEAMEDARIFPPLPSSNKYRGKVTVISGAMAGAARLAVRGAVGAGAGYVVLLGDAAANGPLDAVVHRPANDLDAALADEKSVILLGPGLGRDQIARDLLEAALASSCRLVLDGDALSLLGEAAVSRLAARHERWGVGTVLTPHEGEFTRMFGDGVGSKFDRTQAACTASGATIVHKGHCTIVAHKWGLLTASTAGSTWLATAGAGDVLAGAVAARLACDMASGGYGRPVEQAVVLHAAASHLAGAAFSADRLAECLSVAATGRF